MRIAGLALLALAAPARADDASVWSRVTIELPVYTRHYPNDSAFNDRNWGAFVELGFAHQLSAVVGDFINSYDRNTAVAGVSWTPLVLDASRVRFRFGALVGFDLNGGYAAVNQLDPLLGAFSIRIDGEHFDNALDHGGLAIAILPPAPTNGAVAVNVALALRL